MSNLASIFKSNSQVSEFIVATVTVKLEDAYIVSCNNYNLSVKLAESCLLNPELGDAVLVFHTINENSSYIISILAKSSCEYSTIRLPGGSFITNELGKMTIGTGEFKVTTDKSISLASPSFKVSALLTDISSKFFRANFDYAYSYISKAKFVSESYSSFFGKFVQKAQNCYISIERAIHTKAGSIKTDVNGHSSLNAQNVSVVAKSNVRIDGDKIDLG
jgi:hypothetical protein